MDPLLEHQQLLTRRQFFGRTATGIGSDFAVFPSLILVATLFRLSLNIAATRLILADADAGKVIHAVGAYVVGGNYVIGLVVFLILIVIQFVVITNGAGRVAEVGARFTLDAMPGKQMAIDADLNAGLITDVQARERRAEVSAEAELGDTFGANPLTQTGRPRIEVPAGDEHPGQEGVLGLAAAHREERGDGTDVPDGLVNAGDRLQREADHERNADEDGDR